MYTSCNGNNQTVYLTQKEVEKIMKKRMKEQEKMYKNCKSCHKKK